MIRLPNHGKMINDDEFSDAQGGDCRGMGETEMQRRAIWTVHFNGC
jgi:hypothetical protein